LAVVAEARRRAEAIAHGCIRPPDGGKAASYFAAAGCAATTFP
jgi:hypothetical protein